MFGFFTTKFAALNTHLGLYGLSWEQLCLACDNYGVTTRTVYGIIRGCAMVAALVTREARRGFQVSAPSFACLYVVVIIVAHLHKHTLCSWKAL